MKKQILVIGDVEFRPMMCKDSRPVVNEALDIQIPPEVRCVRYVFGVQILS